MREWTAYVCMPPCAWMSEDAFQKLILSFHPVFKGLSYSFCDALYQRLADLWACGEVSCLSL